MMKNGVIIKSYQLNVNNMLITFAVLAFFWVFFLFYYLKC